MNNELKKIWSRQKKFNEIINGKIRTLDEKQAITKEFILHMISEATEVLDEINWKIHREDVYNKSNPVKESSIREECIDVSKYIISIMQFWGMSSDDFINEFNKKSEVVEQRYKQERQLNLIEDKKVIGIDLDGVVFDYPKSYYDFIKKRIGKKINNNGSYDVYKNVSKEIGWKRAKSLKHQYRESGEKKFISEIKNAAKTVNSLKRRGYKIVILSARPFREYPRIFSDTIFSLKRIGLKYDAIIFNEKKEEKIIERFPKMNFMIEDHGGNALKIAEKGYKVFLLDKPYNQGIEHKNIIRIDRIEEVLL